MNARKKSSPDAALDVSSPGLAETKATTAADEQQSLAPATVSSQQRFIRVQGARTHNLKNISVDIPRDQLVVITGLSGSGKSSLAFDTLYAEGQRRYVESLSAYARQFLQRMDKPDVDVIEGLSPAIAIEQKASSHNPRSTVGTVTEIYDYLRLLFARAGEPHCPDHHLPLAAQSIAQMVDACLALPVGTRLMLLAPMVSERKGEHHDLFDDLRAQGFLRVRIHHGKGEKKLFDLDPPPSLDKNTKHNIDLVIDRLKIQADSKQRLAESFETALRLAHGKVLVMNLDDDSETVYSDRYACPVCDYSLAELEPRLFSFNSPSGACPHCDGLGISRYFDPEKIVAFPELSMASGAVIGWDKRNQLALETLQALAKHYSFDLDTSWQDLPANIQRIMLHGSGEEVISFVHQLNGQKISTKKHPFEGIIPNLIRKYQETDSAVVREELGKLQSQQICPECGGARLRREARFVSIGMDQQKRNLHEITAMPIGQCQQYFRELQLDGARAAIASRIILEINARLTFLNNVGLDYLTMHRSAETLSGGESQRIRLASQIGSGLTGVMYVLDEPSIGLHQRDNDRLLDTLKYLRDLGNSVVVVEHDEDAIRSADYVIDMGPGAGVHGGHVVAAGTPAMVMQAPHSLTGQYLRQERRIPLVAGIERDRKRLRPEHIQIRGASGNNLKHVNVDIPLGGLICITGVSGSGKSTLINDTLLAQAQKQLNRAQGPVAPFDEIHGVDYFDKVIAVDQSPIGRTPRSNPATYTGLFTPIRELFAGVPAAKERGYDAGRFSFNVKGGRCEACQGDGLVKVEMHFLPDVYVPCDVCKGSRYNRETLDIQYRGLNISQVLDLTVEDAVKVFSAVPTLAKKLSTLMEVGLGYIRLGQAATTLSGGEAQRVKLSQELSKRDTGKTLYVLDEPTTGLHFEDIALLLRVINRLVDAGNTVVVIEHNLDVIECADWVIDMGPDGGDRGGQVIAEGSPRMIADNPASVTGRYLRKTHYQD